MRRIRDLRPVNPLGTTYLAVFTVAAAFGGLGATTWFRADVVAMPGTLLWSAALVVAWLVTAPAGPPRKALMVSAWVVGGLLMIMSSSVASSAVLAKSGEQVEATVVALRDGTEKGRHIYYALAGPDGQRIPGELGQWPGGTDGASNNPEGAVGQRVTVVRDPNGLVDPRLPEEVDVEAAGTAWLFVFGVTAVLCALAGRPRVAKSGSRRWRQTEAHASRVEFVRRHLALPDEWWQNADREQRTAYVRDLLAPFLPSDKLLAELTAIQSPVTATGDSNGARRTDTAADE